MKKGIWEKLMQFLVTETRMKAGRDAEPSYALIDSQSVKTAYHSDKKGYNGEKNKRSKTTYSYRYYGKSPCSKCSQSKPT